MDKEVERTLADIEVMEAVFETDGWRKIKDYLVNEVEAIKQELLNVSGERSLGYLQGQAFQINTMVYLEESLQNEKDALINSVRENEMIEEDADLRL